MEATGWKRDASNEALQIVPGVRVCLLGGCYIVEDPQTATVRQGWRASSRRPRRGPRQGLGEMRVAWPGVGWGRGASSCLLLVSWGSLQSGGRALCI